MQCLCFRLASDPRSQPGAPCSYLVTRKQTVIYRCGCLPKLNRTCMAMCKFLCVCVCVCVSRKLSSRNHFEKMAYTNTDSATMVSDFLVEGRTIPTRHGKPCSPAVQSVRLAVTTPCSPHRAGNREHDDRCLCE